MEPIILILAIATTISVLGVLILGILSMMRGGELNKKYGNKLMQLRIGLQALCLLLFACLWFFSNH